MNVEYKSTGTLYDELFTADLKLKHWPNNKEIQERRHELGNVVQGRTNKFLEKFPLDEMLERSREIWTVSKELEAVLAECWAAQEMIMRHTSMDLMVYGDTFALAVAAIQAQQTNALRNKLIRKIDSLLGEDENTQLEKTYG